MSAGDYLHMLTSYIVKQIGVMIEIKDLHKSFGKNHVLKGVEMAFDEPGITAILGPNGSGKTTLMKCILGMVIPDSGTIIFDGKNIKGKWDYRNKLNYLPQIARFPENLIVNELLLMVQDLRSGQVNSKELIELFELQPFLDKRLGNLSGGTRQKVNLVLTFMYDSPVIILDEPTVGLDPVALIRLKEMILEEKKKGKVILITTHIMSFVEEMADNIVFLLEGNIEFKGSLGDIKEKYRGHTLEKAIANILLKENGQALKVEDETAIEINKTSSEN
jgi:Cu-processing system ATP-binding protein